MNETLTTSFRIGGVVGRGFSVFIRNIGVFAVLAFVVFSPLVVAAVFVPVPVETADGSTAVWDLISGLGSFFLSLVLNAAVVSATFQNLRGQPATFSDSLAKGLGRILPVLGVAIVAGLAIAGASLLLLIPGLILYTMFWIAVPVAVVEHAGVRTSLRRSRTLTKGHRWSIFAIILILLAVNILFGVILGLVLVLADVTAASSIVYRLIDVGTTALVGALGAVMTTVGYHDLRAVKEGVGVEEIAAVFD